MFERSKAKKQMEQKLNAIQMNLENNYKDLTIQSRAEAQTCLEELAEKGILKASDVSAFTKRLEEYDRKMIHYGHTNISSFLKERY